MMSISHLGRLHTRLPRLICHGVETKKSQQDVIHCTDCLEPAWSHISAISNEDGVDTSVSELVSRMKETQGGLQPCTASGFVQLRPSC